MRGVPLEKRHDASAFSCDQLRSVAIKILSAQAGGARAALTVFLLDALDHEGFGVCRAVANFRYRGVFR